MSTKAGRIGPLEAKLGRYGGEYTITCMWVIIKWRWHGSLAHIAQGRIGSYVLFPHIINPRKVLGRIWQNHQKLVTEYSTGGPLA